MSKPVVFVIGASGSVGSATVRALSSRHSEKVEIKAGVRNPESEKAGALKSLSGVTVVKACMGGEGLVETFSGVYSLFIVTPSAENRASLTNSTADAAKEAGVKHIFVVSVPVTDHPHLIFGKHFSEIEQHITALGVPYTIVRLPAFLENLLMFKQSIASQNVIHYCANPDTQFDSIAMDDAGNAMAAMLVNPSPYVGSTLTLVSDHQSYNDTVKELSSALGKEISYVQLPIEVMDKTMTERGVPQWAVKGLMELMKLTNDRDPNLVGGDITTYTSITGESPTSVKAWIAKYSAMFK